MTETEREKIEGFIFRLFKGSPGHRLNKQAILDKALTAQLDSSLRSMLEELPVRDYDEDNLLIELNDLIEKKEEKKELVGGVLRKPKRP